MDDLTERRLDTLLDLGRHGEAETGLRDALARDPQDPRALRMLADCLRATDRPREAVEAAESALALAPDDPICLGTLVECLIEDRRREQAVLAAERLVQITPHWWGAHYTLGHALWHAKRYRDALTVNDEAIRLAPHEGAPHNLAGMCLSDLRLNKEAERAYRRSLELDPHSATTLNNLAALRLDTGRLDAATGFLRSGLAHDPQNKWLHHNHDQIVMITVRRLWYAVSVAALTCAVLAIAEVAWWWRAPFGLGVVAAAAVTGHYLTRRLPGGLHGLWGRVGTRQRIALAIVALTGVFAVVLAVLPASTAAGVAGGFLALLRGGIVVFVLAALVGAIVSLLRRS